MQHLELWRFGTDILLLLSLAWLCLRGLRAPSNAKSLRQTEDLQSGLRELIKEADQSSSSLNDQLQRRKKELELLLNDLQAGENKISRLLSGVEETRRQIETLSERAQQSVKAAANTQAQGTVQRSPEVQPSYATESSLRARAPEPPSWKEVAGESRTSAAPVATATNVYGEPLADRRVFPEHKAPLKSSPVPRSTATNPASSYGKATQRYLSSLASQVVREVDPTPPMVDRSPREAEKPKRKAMHAPMPAAAPVPPTETQDDEMFVPDVPTTKAAPVKSQDSDTRLGVLSGIRRQVQAL